MQARASAKASPADTVRDLLKGRHSCRAFLPDEVPENVIRSILECAQRTASWCNTQPWHLVITRGEGTARFREAILHHAREHPAPSSDFPFPREYQGVYQERRRAAGYQLYSAVGVQKGDREASARQALENFELFGAPHVAIVTTPAALGVYGAIDCGAYVANFLIAAQAHGVATIAQAALASYPNLVREHFGLAKDRLIVCGVSFGYADLTHPANSFRTERVDVADAVTWARH